jgi:hypothetical protein
VNFLDFLGFRIADIEPMAKHRKRVNDKQTVRKCLLCDEPSHRRDLCASHGWKYRLLILSTPKNQRHVVEAKLIREGKVGPSRQGKGGGRKRKSKAG